MNSSRLIGLAYVANLMHSGQWSRGYRLLCKIQWNPKGDSSKLQPKQYWYDERLWAAHYMRYARKHKSAF